MSLAHRLYSGEASYEFIRRRRVWYAISGVMVLISLVSMLVRGFDWGIDFKGGATFQFARHGHTETDARGALNSVGIEAETIQSLGGNELRVQTRQLTDVQVQQAETALSQRFEIPADALNPSTVGASWGGQITNKALEGLAIFMVVVVAYIAIRFEPKMAAAAIIALIHDLVITAGVYSLVGFEVTPATVVALLTILGFSLYDTVVVFDKVKENTRALLTTSRSTYSDAANLAVNQTLMRSINTSIIALLPVASLLFVGAGLLGAGTLKDLALAQFVGLASGAYSSIFVATPLLCDLKEREPQMKKLAQKVERQQAKRGAPVAAGIGATGGASRAAGIPAADGADAADAGTADSVDAPVEQDSGQGERPPAAGVRRGAAPAARPRPARRPPSARGRPSGKRRH